MSNKKKVIRTNPKLWEKVKNEVLKGSKGGKKGQWSARKAQLAVKKYKDKGGKYSKKSMSRKSTALSKWTRQDWGTKSGKNSVVGKKATGERYLPKKARQKLSAKEYKKTSDKKRRDMKKNKQYSKQPKKISKKTSPYTKKYKINTNKKTKLFKKENEDIKLQKIVKSDKKQKKWKAIFKVGDKTFDEDFGYLNPKRKKNDYTLHKDLDRRNWYIWRHMKDTQTKTMNPTKPGYLSLYVLWNKDTREKSIEDYKKRLKKWNKTGEFPLKITKYKKPENADEEYQSFDVKL